MKIPVYEKQSSNVKNGVRLPGYKSWHYHSLAVRHSVNSIVFLSLFFLHYEMGIILGLISWIGVRIKCKHAGLITKEVLGKC